MKTIMSEIKNILHGLMEQQPWQKISELEQYSFWIKTIQNKTEEKSLKNNNMESVS